MLINDQEKIKLQNEAISEILLADSNSESGVEADDVEHDFEEEEEEEEEDNYDDDDDDNNNKNNNNNNNNKPHQKSKHRLQQVVDYKPGDCLKEGTQIFILLSDQQEM